MLARELYSAAVKVLLALQLGLFAGWATGCDEWNETDNLTADAKPPTAVPPPIHGAPDGGMPSRGVFRVESDTPLSMEQMEALLLGSIRKQSVEVERVSSAVIVNGMRDCAIWPNQQPGEVSVRRDIQDGFPLGPSMCLQHNGNWQNLHSPQATYATGEAMADNIRKASFFVPSGKCVGFKPYAHENYNSQYTFLGNTVCRGPGQTGENWLLWDANWGISAIKTAFVCHNCQWPPGFL